MAKSRTYVAGFFGTAALLVAGYVAAFMFQMGAPLSAEYWLSDEIKIKEYLAQQINQPKIIISSGSNGLFGIDSPTIEKLTGLPVANLSTHAAMPLDWQLWFAGKNAKHGDVVVMPLEWQYYFIDYTRPYDWVTTNTIAWNREYFDRMPLWRKVKFASLESPAQVLDAVETKLNRKEVLQEYKWRVVNTQIDVVNRYLQWPRYDTTPIYSFLNTNGRGDLMRSCGPSTVKNLDSFAYIPWQAGQLDPRSMKLLEWWRDTMEQRGVRVFITFAPWAKTPYTEDPTFHEKTQAVAKRLAADGFHVLGSPDDFGYKADQFLDSPYHLRCDERLVNSTTIGTLLAKQIKARQTMASE
jgi:hypothetical protein